MTAQYRFGRFELRPATRELLVDGNPAALGGRAFDVLVALIDRRDRLVTKDELLQLAWPGRVVEENNVDVQISALRKILGAETIKTLQGHGYRFTLETEAAPLAPHQPRDNLPHAVTRFIGRERDIDQYELIVATSRLVTLTGVGGCGKTRLALEIATRVRPAFHDGIWFVDLAPITDPERLPSTVARTLDLMEQAGLSMVDALCGHIADKKPLLVLDNCEHVVSASAALVKALIGRTNVHVLATSREALSVPGERILRVRSLDCPPVVDRDHAATDLESFEAVRLFVDRARVVQPAFRLDPNTAMAVADICRRLDGIPLAIELAAARTRVLSVAELQRKLDDRFRLLVGGPRVALPRHQTLLATIKWSFDLLTEQERRFLRSLCVFAGGWTLEAAVAVADTANEYDVLDKLTHLVDKSLISGQNDRHGGTRYSMLETVRQYAVESFQDSNDRQAALQRHLAYFTSTAERLTPEFIDSRQKRALEQLAPELENIVQALTRSGDLPDATELALRLTAALGQLWYWLGLPKLGYDLTTKVLSMPASDAASLPRARAMFVATRLAVLTARNDDAQAWGSQCLAAARSVNDHHTEAAALSYLGFEASMRGDNTTAIDYGEAAVQLAREHRDDESLRRALNSLGNIHINSGNHQAARAAYLESLQLGRVQGDFHAIATVAGNLAEAYLSYGEFDEARPLVAEALAASVGDKITMEATLERVAELAAATDDWRFAARMWGTVKTVNKASGRLLAFGPTAALFLAAVSALDEHPELRAPFDAGCAITLDEAIPEALAWLESGNPRRRTADQ